MTDAQYIQLEDQPSVLTEFCRDSLRPRSVTYLAWLLVAGLMSFAVYLLTSGSPLGSVRPALWVYYMVVGVHIILRLRNRGKAVVLSFDFLFLVFYSAFHLGYISLYDLGIVPYADPPFIFSESIPKSLFIVNLGVISFLFGYTLLGGRRAELGVDYPVLRPKASWCSFGVICIITAVIVHMMVIAYMGMTFFTVYGYRIFQDIQKYGGSFLIALLWRYSAHLMTFGLVVYIVSSALRYGQLFRSKLALVFVITYAVLLIMEGERGGLVRLFVPIILVRHYFIKRMKIRYLLLLALACLVLFSAMAAVRTIVFQPQKMLEAYRYQKQAGDITWMNLPAEAGFSYQTLNITAHEVPVSEGYWHGASWRDAIIHIVPFLQGYTFSRGISTWAPSAWVTVTYFGPERAGRGFTIAAEGYLNFGYIGVIIELMFYGLFIRWLTVKFSRNPSAMYAIIMLGCFGIALLTIRSHTGVLIAPSVRLIIATFLLHLFLRDEPLFESEMEGYHLPYDDSLPAFAGDMRE